MRNKKHGRKPTLAAVQVHAPCCVYPHAQPFSIFHKSSHAIVPQLISSYEKEEFPTIHYHFPSMNLHGVLIQSLIAPRTCRFLCCNTVEEKQPYNEDADIFVQP
jgi:hypothetical protein